MSFLPFDSLNLLSHLAIFKISKDVPVSSHHLSSCTYQGVQRDQVDHGVLVCRAYPETQVGLPDKQEILFHLFHLLVPFLQVSLAYPHPLKEKQGRSSEQFLKNTAQRPVMEQKGKLTQLHLARKEKLKYFAYKRKGNCISHLSKSITVTEARLCHHLYFSCFARASLRLKQNAPFSFCPSQLVTYHTALHIPWSAHIFSTPQPCTSGNLL